MTKTHPHRNWKMVTNSMDYRHTFLLWANCLSSQVILNAATWNKQVHHNLSWIYENLYSSQVTLVIFSVFISFCQSLGQGNGNVHFDNDKTHNSGITGDRGARQLQDTMEWISMIRSHHHNEYESSKGKQLHIYLFSEQPAKK